MIVSKTSRLIFTAQHLGFYLLALMGWDFLIVLGERVMGWSWMSWSNVPLALYGAVIGIVVSFRNSSAYARWWEARILWGAIVNKSRTFARQVLASVAAKAGATADEQAEVKTAQKRLVLYQVAYVHALRQQLRGLDPLAAMAHLIPQEDVAALAQEKNIALALQRRIGDVLITTRQRGWLDSWEWQAIDQSLDGLMDAQGGAERIKNTPLPKQYDLFPRIFVMIYCLIMPLGIADALGWFTPLGSTLVGFMFLAWDTIGRDLEDPFDNTIHDVPMTAITTTIEINLRQLLGETDLPKPAEPIHGVLW